MEQHSSTISTQLATEQLNATSSTVTQSPGHLLSSTVLGLCCLLGLPGNVAVLVVILLRFRRPDFTLWLMLNLASSDIVCLSTVPVWVYTLLHGWTLGRAACKLATFFLYLSLYANVLTVTLLSVQRYIQVLYPHRWARLGHKGEGTLLVVLWLLACALAAPAVATRDVKDGELKCRRHAGSDAERVAVLVFETLLGFVVPFSILATCYSCLHKRVNQTALFNSARMTRLVTSIVAAFFILWIPVHMVNVVDIIGILLKSTRPAASETLLRYKSTAARVVRSLTFVNSCLDPFLYAFASPKVRKNPESTEVSSRAQITNV